MTKLIRFYIALLFVLISVQPVDAEQVLVLEDNFNGNISDNWNPGRASDQGVAHSLTISDGKLRWGQAYDYIESKVSFGNDLRIEFDYSATTGSVQQGEFWVELVALTNSGNYTAGIYRSQYGVQNYHAVNVGRAPSVTDSTVTDSVSKPPYLKTMAPGSPRQGKVIFSFINQKVRMQFENQDEDIVSTDWVSTGNFTQTKIRIWGMGQVGAYRYIDNVRVYAPSGLSEEDSEPEGYTFVKIAGTGAGFEQLDMEPTLNDSGTVAFWAEQSTGVDGIYTGNGGPLTTVLHVNDTGVQDIWGFKSINNSGAVAVQLQYLANNTTIEVRKGATHTSIVSVNGTAFTQLSDPQINDNGLVAFWGKKTSSEGIYTGNGSTAPVAICDTSAGADFYGFGKYASIGNDGNVAFAAKPNGGEYKLYKSNGTTRTLIVQTGSTYLNVGGADGECAINNDGRVLYLANEMSGTDVLMSICSSTGDSTTRHIEVNLYSGTSPFNTLGWPPAFNDSLDLAFMATHDGFSSGTGLYTGPDPVNHKVIEPGDTLDGKVVHTIATGRHCINAHGQIVFFVGFTNGSQGIYRADPSGKGEGSQGRCPWCPPLYFLIL